MSDGGHPPTAGDPAAADTHAKSDRFYFAQCLKDETMAESIADGWQKNYGRHATVVDVNGSFHSDYVQGVAAATMNRMGGRRVAVVSLVPVDDIDAATPDADDMKLGDYVVYTVKPITGADPASPPRRTSSPR